MERIRWALTTGTLDAAISSGATEISSVALEDFPVVAEGQVAVVILDPAAISGAPECIYITAHADGASTATVLRGQEQAVGHGPARAHGTGTAWHHAPTPVDFGPAPFDAVECGPGELVEIVAGPDGRLAAHAVIFVPGDSSPTQPFVTIPPARNHPGEVFLTSMVPGAVTAGVGVKDPTPWAGTASVAGWFAGLLAAIGEGNSVDLTTATLGHPFVMRPIVDGVEETGDPVDDVFGPMISGDGYAEVIRLLGAIVPSFTAAGATVNPGTGVVTSPTTGFGSTVALHVDQEEIAGFDLAANLNATAVDGKNGTIVALGDANAGGLGVLDHFDPAEWEIDEAGTHTSENFALPMHRGTLSFAQGNADRWTSIAWNLRANEMLTPWPFAVLPEDYGSLLSSLLTIDDELGISRTVEDAVVTEGDTTLTSATAAFDATLDLGARIQVLDVSGNVISSTVLVAGTTAEAIVDADEITLSDPPLDTINPARVKITRPLSVVLADLLAAPAPSPSWPRRVSIDFPKAHPDALSGTWTPTVDTNGIGNGYAQSAGTNDQSWTYYVDLDAGTWEARLVHLKSTSSGILAVSLDGTSLGTVDAYNGSSTRNNVATFSSIVVTAAGRFPLVITNPTKNASSSGYTMNLQYVDLRRTGS